MKPIILGDMQGKTTAIIIDYIDKILYNYNELKDCMYYWKDEDEQCTQEKGIEHVNRMLYGFEVVSNSLRELIYEYYSILEQQIEDLDIDTYKSLKLSIIDAENYINEIINKKITPQVDLLFQLKHNMSKNRNKSDLMKIIDKIKIPKSDEIEPVNPITFILHESRVI